MAQLVRVPSNNSSAGVDPSEKAWEDNEDTINDVESLGSGIIKTSKNKANAPYTILLVGETGVGKSSIFELIANVLAGNAIDNCDLGILDHANERGGSNNQSQTSAARFYELKSKNGIVVRILDTPGLADTRGIEQDELHKKSIAAQIEQHVDNVTAILVLANGTVPRVTVGTNYALSTLSAIFPEHLTSNIAFLFTNVLSPLHWNFSRDTVPPVLKDAPQFLLNNPIALHKKYLTLQNNSHVGKGLHREVLAGEQKALETLVDLFDWLDGLQPLPKAEFFAPRGEPQDRLAPKDRRGAQNTKNSASTIGPSSASNLGYLCTVPYCYSTCSVQLSPICMSVAGLIPWVQLVLCAKCAHPYLFHVHMSRLPVQGGLGDLVDSSMDELPRVAKDNAGPWPPEGLSARLDKAARLLEQNHEHMAENGVSLEQLENMRCSLEWMKMKLDVLRTTKEKVWDGVCKVFGAKYVERCLWWR